MTFPFWLKAFLVMLGSIGFTAGYIAFARRRSIVDIPNERSSHSKNTVRGGGLLFPVALVLYVCVEPSLRVLTLGCALIALVGFWDDVYHLSSFPKLFAYLFCVVLTLWLSGNNYSVLGLASSIFLVLYATNLFNFMDGTDGLVGGLSLVGGFWSYFVLAKVNPSSPLANFLPFFLFVLLGFLVFNWSPAKVFMGDVGSNFLGFFFSAGMILEGGLPAAMAVVVVFAPLFGDATVTLLQRLIQGENVFQAHRSHAYQKSALQWGSHALVALLYGVFALLVAGPLAYLAVSDIIAFPLAFLGAYIPVVVFCLVNRAGLKEALPTPA